MTVVYAGHFNGNNPQRHAQLLTALRTAGLRFEVERSLLDPHGSRQDKEIRFDRFCQTLVPDSDVFVRVDTDEGILVMAQVARDPERPNEVWSLEHHSPYDRDVHGLLLARMTDIYGPDLVERHGEARRYRATR